MIHQDNVESIASSFVTGWWEQLNMIARAKLTFLCQFAGSYDPLIWFSQAVDDGGIGEGLAQLTMRWPH